MDKKPRFIVFAGLPGVGKTTIARELARILSAVYLRIDSLEHALDACGAIALHSLGPGGYHAAAAIAVDNLRNGQDVVADSVNPWPITRELWQDAAEAAGAEFVGIEIVCSDPLEHQRRVEQRKADIDGFSPPTWEAVLAKDYVRWEEAALTLDTAVVSAEEAVVLAANAVAEGGRYL